MKILKIIIAVFIISFGCFFIFWMYPRYSVPVLTYHSFDNRNELLSVAPENFAKQMRYLKDRGYSVISLDGLMEGVKNNKKFARNTVVITMDDGYKNNYIYAYPILKQYNFPAMIFVVTDYIGKNKSFLNWNEIKEMSKNGILFGAHTKSHLYLPSSNDENVLRNEILGSKKAIESQIGMQVDYFCYPSGGFNDTVKKVVEEAGFKGACATNRGKFRSNKNNIYELNRISMRNIDPYFSFFNIVEPIKFWVKLTGYYDLFRSKKEGY